MNAAVANSDFSGFSSAFGLHLGAVGPDVHGAVHRLHGGVSREGKFVRASTLFAELLRAASASPSWRTTLPGLAAWSRNCWRSEAEDSDAAGPSSQVI